MSPDDRPIAEDAYDELAEAYREHEDDPYCADLEFPAMIDLVPEVDGKRILDAGCGYGRYSEWLLDHGADVVAFDTSEKMIDGERERIGDRATVLRADMERPLDIADDGAFDGVVSGLSLHYVENWRQPFAEFSRLSDRKGSSRFRPITRSTTTSRTRA